LTVYQNRRWDSDLRTLRGLLDRGELGRVRRFESSFERFSPEPGPPAAGGGTLLDFGSPLVDQALHLFGPAESVHAELMVRSNGLDDDVFVSLAHRSGARSHLSGSWVQGAPRPRLRVTGSSATYVVEGMDVQESQLLAGLSPATAGDKWGLETDGRGSGLRAGEAFTPVPLERGRWDLFYPAFAAAVRGEGAVPVDPRDAVRTAEVLDAARRSAATGQTVRIEEGA
jgi:predicted dehydrogenase